MKQTAVNRWFGDAFSQLAPELRGLHLSDQTLSGEVEIFYPQGLAGSIGRRLGAALGMPRASGVCDMRVTIRHSEQQMIWIRQFGQGGPEMRSAFEPVGSFPEGYWKEANGASETHLGVIIRDGAWHWQQRRIHFGSLPIPELLAPQLTAFKSIEGDRYKFFVELKLPWLGICLRYSGMLRLAE